MTKRNYRFDIVSVDGGTLKRHNRRCFAASAPNYAAQLLEKDPRAAAVFAFERRGPACHAVYRNH